MKKLFTLLFFLAINWSISAQSQRLVLVEHFTQASCGPCASQNPPLRQTLLANKSKVIAIKHQTSWPGVDPMNNDNPQDAGARVAYYRISGVPRTVLDGTEQGPPNSVITTSSINARYKVPSPFTMELTATNTSSLDHLDVHVKIIATQDISGTLNAKIAVVEEAIVFSSAPGSNGEKAFYNVLKALLPSSRGQALPQSFKKGDVFEFDVEWDIQNVYDIKQLAIVGYIQEDSNKKIHQASYHPPFMKLNEGDDASIKWVSIDNNIDDNEVCGQSANPRLRLVNTGSRRINTAKIEYSINGGPLQEHEWSGRLSFLKERTVDLPEIAFTNSANNKIYAKVISCNGNDDVTDDNSTHTSHFNYAPTVTNKIVISLTNMRKPDLISWKILNGEGELHAESGVFTSKNSEISVDLEDDECYEFIIKNTSTAINGKFKIRDANDKTVIYKRAFPAETELKTDYTTSEAVATDDIINSIDLLNISPNPSNGKFEVQLIMNKELDAQIEITSIMGSIIYSNDVHLINGDNLMNINLNNTTNGVYLVQIIVNDKRMTKRIIIAH